MMSQNTPKKILNTRGFTLIELILGMLIVVATLGFLAQTLYSQSQVYSRIRNQSEATPELDFAFRSIKSDLLHIGDSGLVDVSTNSIKYFNASGEQVLLELVARDGKYNNEKNGETLVQDVDDFTLNYYDAAGDELNLASSSVSDVKRIKVEINKNQTKEGGGSKYSAVIVPRSFLGFSDYQ